MMKTQMNSDTVKETCRACMKFDTNYVYLFEESVLELFKKFTNLMPTEDDQLPRIICGNCKKILENFQTFYTKCLESDLHYKSNLVKQEQGLTFRQPEPIEELAYDDDPSGNFSPFDDNIFHDEIKTESSEQLEKHNLNLDKVLLSTDMKPDQKKSDPRKKRIGVKKKTETNLVTEPNSNKENSIKTKAKVKLNREESKKKKHKNAYLDKYRGHFICPIPACNKTFVFETSLRTHMDVHDPNYDPKSLPRPFICEHCGFAFKKEGQLNSHVRNKHGPAQEHSCKHCIQKFSTKTRLRLHIEKEHLPPKVYSCDICNKPVGRSHAAIRSHMIFIHLRKDHPCITCGKSFRRPFELRKHIEWVHLGESRFVCQICNAKFSSKQMLDYHSFHHSDGVKKFKCTYCDWASRKHADLKRHVDFFHLGIKRHTCQYCEKSFFDPKVKKHHEMTHTGERPEICNICNKSFIQKIALKKHMQTHDKS